MARISVQWGVAMLLGVAGCAPPETGVGPAPPDELQYGVDGRLLTISTDMWRSQEDGWHESRSLSTYRYAGDGRILEREDQSGSTTVILKYEYTCP